MTHAGGTDRVVSLEEARKAFRRGGFSVVINRLQRRWRGVLRASRALEDVLGQPVNANLYMTPPQSQGFEAHFDWMDGIVVQLTGSKTWILYDEMVTMPRPEQKFKPKAAELGEPIAVLDLHPGDMMYIPRGWPHEAAVNGTAARPGGGRGASPSSSAARGPSLHLTFGVETALSGTYESLLHHALEVAAVEHPLLFGLSPREGEESDKQSANDSDEDNQGRMGGDAEVPWLQLLHLWVHDVASRDARLRKAVPLAPLFSASSEGRPAPPTAAKHNSDARSIDDDDDDVAGGRREGVCTASAQRQEQHQTAAAPPRAVLQEFKISLEACAGSAAADDAHGVGGAASSTLALLDSLLENEQLYRVREMFFVGDGELRGRGGGESSGGCAATAAAQRGGEDEDAADAVLSSRMSEEADWSRATLGAFDRTLFSSSSLREKMEGFRKVASPEGALRRMVLASSRRARERDEITERDLAKCGQGPPSRCGVAV
ncbi:unnamed protein product [Ectocarpus sp. 12 AP-2014]